MVNKKLQKLLKDSKEKTMYGISKALGISPQSAQYIIKGKQLEKDINRIKVIAEYMGVPMHEILDGYNEEKITN